jgi:hypothetical protein
VFTLTHMANRQLQEQTAEMQKAFAKEIEASRKRFSINYFPA